MAHKPLFCSPGGYVLDPKMVAKAIIDHAKETGEDPNKLLRSIANGDMIVLPWKENELTIMFNDILGR